MAKVSICHFWPPPRHSEMAARLLPFWILLLVFKAGLETDRLSMCAAAVGFYVRHPHVSAWR